MNSLRSRLLRAVFGRFLQAPVPQWNAPALPKRVVLFGPPLVGKSEIIRAVAQQLGGVANAFKLSDGTAPITAAVGNDFAVAALTSSRYRPAEHRALLEWANRLLLVLDPQRAMENSTREVLSEFRGSWELIEIRATQVTKRDIVEASPQACFTPEDVPRQFGVASCPQFISSTRDQPSLTAGVRYLIGAG